MEGEVLTDLLGKLDRRKEAVAWTEKCIANRDSARLRIILASSLEAAGEKNRAAAALEEALQVHAESEEIGTALARSRLEAGMHAECIALCADLRKRGMSGSILRKLQGQAEFALCKFAEALASFESALALDPENDEIAGLRDKALEAVRKN